MFKKILSLGVICIFMFAVSCKSPTAITTSSGPKKEITYDELRITITVPEYVKKADLEVGFPAERLDFTNSSNRVQVPDINIMRIAFLDSDKNEIKKIDESNAEIIRNQFMENRVKDNSQILKDIGFTEINGHKAINFKEKFEYKNMIVADDVYIIEDEDGFLVVFISINHNGSGNIEFDPAMVEAVKSIRFVK